MELLIGCGHDRRKKVVLTEAPEWEWQKLVTLDWNPEVKPDIVADLETLPLPFADNTFDEIHAYEVLEHTGAQGDWKFFFNQFTDFWRILKPGGLFFATVPSFNSLWAWGDPSHKRVINQGTLVFLSQKTYDADIAKGGPMSDFRWFYKADFDILATQDLDDGFIFILRAIK